MATLRAVGFKVTAAIWNAVLTSINDAGTIWAGAVNGTTGAFTPSLAVAGAADNTGLVVSATSTNRPALLLQNAATGVLATVQATNDKGMVLYANGSAEQVMKLHATGGVSIGGATAPADGCLAVEGGAIYLPDSNASDGVAIFGNGGTNISAIYLNSGARGTGAVTGNVVAIGHNSSGSGAAGFLSITDKAGVYNALWPDNTGVWRTANVPPEEDGTPSDTSGSVVGGQTSWHESKSNVVPTAVTPAEALQTILETPIYDFQYPAGGFRDGDDQPIVFTGFVGYDRHDWFLTNAGSDQNPELDEVTVPGYMALAFKAMAAKIEALEARVAALEAVR